MSETSKTVTNALDLLNCFSRAQPVLTASEIARRLKLARTSVIRLLATLDSFGFVQKNPDGIGYQVGLRSFEIGTLFLVTNPLSVVLMRVLDELVEKTQCTAYFAILDKDDIVLLNVREGTLPIRFVWRVGDRLPAHTTALGKAILMHMSSDEIDKCFGGNDTLRGLTEKSLMTRQQLDEDLAQARARGWGLAREESHAGLTAVGSAVLGTGGKPLAAISISFLDYPPDPHRLNHFAKIVREAAEGVSSRISDYGSYGSYITP